MNVKYLLVAVLILSLVTTADAGVFEWIWKGGKWLWNKLTGRSTHTVVVQAPPPQQPMIQQPMMPQQYDPQYGR